MPRNGSSKKVKRPCTDACHQLWLYSTAAQLKDESMPVEVANTMDSRLDVQHSFEPFLPKLLVQLKIITFRLKGFRLMSGDYYNIGIVIKSA